MCHYGHLTNPQFGIFSPGYYTLHTSHFILRTKLCTHYTLATFPAALAMAIGIDKAVAMTVAMAVDNALADATAVAIVHPHQENIS